MSVFVATATEAVRGSRPGELFWLPGAHERSVVLCHQFPPCKTASGGVWSLRPQTPGLKPPKADESRASPRLRRGDPPLLSYAAARLRSKAFTALGALLEAAKRP